MDSDFQKCSLGSPSLLCMWDRKASCGWFWVYLLSQVGQSLVKQSVWSQTFVKKNRVQGAFKIYFSFLLLRVRRTFSLILLLALIRAAELKSMHYAYPQKAGLGNLSHSDHLFLFGPCSCSTSVPSKLVFWFCNWSLHFEVVVFLVDSLIDLRIYFNFFHLLSCFEYESDTF